MHPRAASPENGAAEAAAAGVELPDGEPAPVCSGVLALRRVTSLLSSARRADAQGKYQQARELYSEVLKVQKSLAKAPLGSIGKSLRGVCAGVEARLQQLRHELREADSTTGGSSRPATNASAPSSSSSAAAAAAGPVGFAGQPEGDEAGSPAAGVRPGANMTLSWGDLPGQTTPRWNSAASPSGGPASARDAFCSARPETRDGSRPRPHTQEGSARDGAGAEGHYRPQTRDGSSRQSSLDGVRPNTRDGQRLQQMIDGSRRGSSRGAAPGAGAGAPPPRDSRPQTRDSARPPTRSGLGTAGSSRGLDVSIRQASGRRKRHERVSSVGSHQTAESPSLDGGAGCRSESLGVFPADESVDLLE